MGEGNLLGYYSGYIYEEIYPETGESFLYEEIYPQTGNELRCRTLMLW
jgi:hypothetical protein